MTDRQRDTQIKSEKENDPKGNEKIKGILINTRMVKMWENINQYLAYNSVIVMSSEISLM